MHNLNFPVCIVQGTGKRIVQHWTIRKLLQKISIPSDADTEFSDKVARWAKEYKDGYARLKNDYNSDLKGFIIGNFYERRDTAIREYVPLMVFDIDGISNSDSLYTLLSDCANVPHIFAAFPSPSKKGLRILIWTNSTLETHKRYYAALAEYLATNFNITTRKKAVYELKIAGIPDVEHKNKLKHIEHIDTSTSAISNMFYFTAQKDAFYVNNESEVWTTLPPLSRPVAKARISHTRNYGDGLPIITKLELINAIIENRNESRNNSVFQFCRLASEYKISFEDAYAYCQKWIDNEPPVFGFDECKKSAQSGYKKNSETYLDKQLIKYVQTVIGKDKASAIIARYKLPSKSKDIGIGHFRVWALLSKPSQREHNKRINEKRHREKKEKGYFPNITLFSKPDKNFFSQINLIFGKISEYKDFFDRKFAYRLSVTKLRLQDKDDINNIYFEFRLSGKITMVNDHGLKNKLIEEGIIDIDANNDLWFTHFVHHKTKNQEQKTTAA
jgi:hypothetical protein